MSASFFKVNLSLAIIREILICSYAAFALWYLQAQNSWQVFILNNTVGILFVLC